MIKLPKIIIAVLVVAALGEALTGLALVARPSLVVELLFGAEITGVGIVMSRVAGIALIALGIACWPCSEPGRPGRPALGGMLTYSALATGYLAWLGIRGEWVGSLLWTAVVLHAILTLLLAWARVHVRQKECDECSPETEARTQDLDL